MPKKAYLSVSFQQRHKLTAEFAILHAVLQQMNITPIDFVNEFSFEANQEKEMMQAACQQIQNAAFLVAEVSEKAIGVGIEVGYAAALNKPVIYLRKADSEHSTTVAGLANYSFVYHDLDDLREKFTTAVQACLTELSHTFQ